MVAKITLVGETENVSDPTAILNALEVPVLAIDAMHFISIPHRRLCSIVEALDPSSICCSCMALDLGFPFCSRPILMAENSFGVWELTQLCSVKAAEEVKSQEPAGLGSVNAEEQIVV